MPYLTLYIGEASYLSSTALLKNTGVKNPVFHGRFRPGMECSHARFNTSDEHVADCQGLVAMAQDMSVTPSIIATP